MGDLKNRVELIQWIDEVQGSPVCVSEQDEYENDAPQDTQCNVSKVGLLDEGREGRNADGKHEGGQEGPEQPAIHAQAAKQPVRHTLDVDLHGEQDEGSHDGGGAHQCAADVEDEGAQAFDVSIAQEMWLKRGLDKGATWKLATITSRKTDMPRTAP